MSQSAGSTFHDELRLQFMYSERTRMLLLGCIFAALCFLVIFVSSIYEPPPEVTFDRQGFIYIAFILGGAALYEFIIRYRVGRAITLGKPLPQPLRYLNATTEIGIPTAIIAVTAYTMDPAEALFSPPSYAYLLFILLSVLRLDFRLSTYTGAASALGYSAVTVYFWPEVSRTETLLMATAVPIHVAKVAIYIFGGLVAGYVGREIQSRYAESLDITEQKNKLYETFGRHVSPQVVEKLIAAQDTEPDNEIREVCVMFLDIRGFSSFSEDKPPDEVIAFLNTMFADMVDTVTGHGGIINKFLGDGFMAVFGAPLSEGKDTQNAYMAALKLVQDLQAEVDAGNLPATRIGIGLHTGEVLTGNVGSNQRREYTIIGDTVNVAARLEQLSKNFDGDIIISETVVAKLTEEQQANIKHAGPVDIRGRQNQMRVFEVDH